MRLRFGRISLCGNLSSPYKTFPITPHILSETESPLRAHYNPQAVSTNSLEDFLDRFLAALIFFCNADFKEQSLTGIGHTALAFSYPYTSLKAGYSVHSTNAPHKQVSPQSVGDFHFYRVGPPRQLGRDLHAVASRPKALTPSNSPNLGKRSHHQKLHRYALRRYFTPVSGRWNLTRILRHHLYYYNKYNKNVNLSKNTSCVWKFLIFSSIFCTSQKKKIIKVLQSAILAV